MNKIQFTVYGEAKPAGSKRALVITPKGGGKPRAIVTDANKNSQSWKQEVSAAASMAYSGKLLEGPLFVTFSFYRVRPKGHLKKDGNLTSSAPLYPTTRPDLLKVARGIEDSLTGVIYKDDSQIVNEVLEKLYGDKAYVVVTILHDELTVTKGK